MPDAQNASLHERIPDAVLLCRFEEAEQQLIVVSVNEATLRMFDTDREVLVGHAPRVLLAGSNVFQDAHARREIFAELRRTGQLLLPQPLRVEVRGATRQVRARLWWSDPETNDVLVVGEDVTDSVEDSRRARARERLTHAAELASVLSHHLNNSLAIARFEIDHARELAEEHEVLGEDIASSLRSAAEAMERSADIVRGLASVTTTAPRPSERGDIDGALRELVKGRSRFHVATPPTPTWVAGDSPSLRLVLEAVLDLASTAEGNASEPRVTLSFERDGRFVCLALDYDLAIPPVFVRMIVDPSTGTVSADEAPVRFFAAIHILHALGGSLGPHPDRERRVVLRLPGSVSDASAEQARASVLLVTRDGGLIALLNSPELRYSIVHAEDGRAAARLLLRRQVDVVLYDGETLDLSSRELAAIDRIRDRASARVVFITRDDDLRPDAETRSLRVPFDRADVERAVADVIEDLGRA